MRRSKHRFRILNRRYSHAHVDRLHQQNVQSIETSSLHLGLLGDMQRLNSLFCSVAYSSYPHPKLMPEFWQFPTVSMGLGPIGAIYQAKFLKYLEHRAGGSRENAD